MASKGREDVQEELKRYLEEKKLNSIFVAIVETLLLEKPNEPISFIVQYLKVCQQETIEISIDPLNFN